jgi:hypothetical protein
VTAIAHAVSACGLARIIEVRKKRLLSASFWFYTGNVL